MRSIPGWRRSSTVGSATYSSILAWKIPRTAMGSQRVVTELRGTYVPQSQLLKKKKKAAVTGLAQMRGSPRTRIGCQAVRQLSCFSEFMPYGTIEHFESHCLVLAAEF